MLIFFSVGNYKNAKPGEPLYDLGMARLDDFVGTFADDVANDRLPQVSWLVGPAWLSEHASNHPADGEALSAKILAVLGDNPQVYKKTAFILNYDEGGQFVDHHWTPVPPKDRSDGLSTVSVKGELTLKEEFNIPAGNPIGLGFRVPLFLVSPWTRGDYVFSQVSDHTSVIQFIEKRFGVRCPNISPWRRAVTSDLTAAFDFENPDYSWPANLPDTSGNADASAWQCKNNPPPVVPAQMSMPAQEPGTKKQRSLPYSFEISDVQKDASVTITMNNIGAAAAVFFVYDRVAVLSPPRKYTVEAGKQLADTWGFAALGKYDFRLHGPNGFVRMFAGTPSDDAHSVAMTYDGKNDAVVLTSAKVACATTYTVVDNAYGAAARTFADGSSLSINVASSGNWYDVTVSVASAACSGEASTTWSRRFMGKMENGKETTTDPAMSKPLPLHFVKHPHAPDHLQNVRWFNATMDCSTRRAQLKDICTFSKDESWKMEL